MHTHHFAAMILFALLVSAAFAALGERTLSARLRHATRCFLLFMVFAVGFAWLLFPLSR
jgi:hypothetical protein